MKHYLKISYVSQNELDGKSSIANLGLISTKTCPSFKNILIPMDSEDPKEASAEYRNIFEILKMFERENGAQVLKQAIMTAINSTKESKK
jgi:hypothetical protein